MKSRAARMSPVPPANSLNTCSVVTTSGVSPSAWRWAASRSAWARKSGCVTTT